MEGLKSSNFYSLENLLANSARLIDVDAEPVRPGDIVLRRSKSTGTHSITFVRRVTRDDNSYVTSDEQQEGDESGNFTKEVYRLDKSIVGRSSKIGANFPYLLKKDFPYDLYRYGIHKNIEEKDYPNCFVHCLEQLGYDTKKIQIGLNRTNYITTGNLTKVAKQLNIIIKITKSIKSVRISSFYGGEKVTRSLVNPDNKPVINLALMENHYFIKEKTNIPVSWVETYKKRNQSKIDSLKVVEYLLQNKERFLKDYESSVYATTAYKVLKENKTPDLSKIEDDQHLTEFKERTKENPTIFYADTETYAAKKKLHTPYLFAAISEDREKTIVKYYDKTCEKNVIYRGLKGIADHVKKQGKRRVLVYFHNLGYDGAFIINQMSTISSSINKSAKSMILLSGMFNGIIFEFHDTYPLTLLPLSQFGKAFGLQIEKKEDFDYSLQTLRNIEKDNLTEKDLENSKAKDEILKEYKGSFKQYAIDYCVKDVEVLLEGFVKHKNNFRENFGLNIDNYPTIASVSINIFKKEGCFDQACTVSGILQAYLSNAVVGGRVMIGLDEDDLERPQIIRNKKLRYLDATSLYPAAFVAMPGIPIGKAKIITNWLERDTWDYYVATIRVLSENKNKKRFPLTSYKDEGDETRTWTNDLTGKTVIVDKIMLEMWEEDYDIKYEFITGVYWGEGLDKSISKHMQKVFDKRNELKKEKNPSQLTYKLCMNSAFGKTIQRPIETKVTWINKYSKNFSEKNFENSIIENLQIITEVRDTGNFLKTERLKPILEHKNYPHVGAMILSQSKKIMNDILKHIDENSVYGDTDSVLVEDAALKKVPPELFGSTLGKFHDDFEIADGYSNYTILLGKKSYMCIVENDAGDRYVHYRLKGVSRHAIEREITIIQKESECDREKAFKILYKTMMYETVEFNNIPDEGFKGKHNPKNPTEIKDIEKDIKAVGCFYQKYQEKKKATS